MSSRHKKMGEELLSLQWMEHSSTFNQSIGALRNKNLFTDATLACEGKFFPVHKFVLSTCSEYFNAIFEYTPCVNPVVVINNIPCNQLEPLLDFMYKGEAIVTENLLKPVVKAAECLCIKGLSMDNSGITCFSGKENENRDEKSMEPKKKRNRSAPKKKNTPTSLKQTMPSDVFSHSSNNNISCSAQESSDMLPSTLSNAIASSPIPNNLTGASSVSESSLSNSICSSPQNSTPRISASWSISKQNYSPSSPNASLVFQDNNESAATNNMLESEQGSNLSNPVSLSDNVFPSLKESDNNLDLSSFPPLSSNGASHMLSPVPDCQYSQPLMVADGSSNENLSLADVPQLPQIDQKLIGDEINLDGPVKGLHITTDDGGRVTIPEILEGFAEMPNLYESKVQHPQELDSNDTNDTLYDFSEDLQESPVPVLNKERVIRTFSNPLNKRKLASTEISPHQEPTRILQFSISTPSGSGSPPKPIFIDKKEPKPSFVCTTCSKTYSKKELLTRHMRTHSEYPYVCTLCPYKSKVYKELITHRKNHATKHCDMCDFVTIRADALRRHKQQNHEAKNHKCPFPNCSQAFLKPEKLNSHLLSHEKKKADNKNVPFESKTSQ